MFVADLIIRPAVQFYRILAVNYDSRCQRCAVTDKIVFQEHCGADLGRCNRERNADPAGEIILSYDHRSGCSGIYVVGIADPTIFGLEDISAFQLKCDSRGLLLAVKDISALCLDSSSFQIAEIGRQDFKCSLCRAGIIAAECD